MTRWLLALVGLTITATEFRAQSPTRPDTSTVTVFRGRDLTRDDSLAIRNAAAKSLKVTDKEIIRLQVPSAAVVNDTATAFVAAFSEPTHNHLGITTVRVELRGGRWVVVPPDSGFVKDKKSPTREGTLAIRRAAADSGEAAVVERIVADTAWALVADRRNLIDIPGGPGLTAGTAIVANKRVRLERRGGQWVKAPPK